MRMGTKCMQIIKNQNNLLSLKHILHNSNHYNTDPQNTITLLIRIYSYFNNFTYIQRIS